MARKIIENSLKITYSKAYSRKTGSFRNTFAASYSM